MPWRSTRTILIAAILLLVVGVPLFVDRLTYTHARRLRPIEPGKIYRSGQLTTEGFADAVKRYGIRTILNLQNDKLDPKVERGYLDRRTVRESELCKELNVNYRVISPDLQNPRDADQGARPRAVDEFLKIMDDPEVYPVLIHCKAGLHRTGILAAVYRMEYQGWTVSEAHEELKAHGFGDRACTSANEYVRQYVLKYQPGQRRSAPQSSETPLTSPRRSPGNDQPD